MFVENSGQRSFVHIVELVQIQKSLSSSLRFLDIIYHSWVLLHFLSTVMIVSITEHRSFGGSSLSNYVFFYYCWLRIVDFNLKFLIMESSTFLRLYMYLWFFSAYEVFVKNGSKKFCEQLNLGFCCCLMIRPMPVDWIWWSLCLCLLMNDKADANWLLFVLRKLFTKDAKACFEIDCYSMILLRFLDLRYPQLEDLILDCILFILEFSFLGQNV